MRTLLTCLVLAALACIAVAAGDVSGKWSGSFDMIGPNGEIKTTTAMFVLKQSGTDVTGTVGPDEHEQFAIQTGKIDGGKVTLVADRDGRTIKFDLVLAADRLTGEANLTGQGQTAKARVNVIREK